MNKLLRWGLASLLAVQMLVLVPSAGVAGWRVVPTTGFVDLTGDLDLIKTLSSLQIMSGTNSEQLYLHQSIPVVEGDVIDAVAICYRTFAFVSGDRPPFITEIGLTEVLFPASSTIKHLDPTDLTSLEDTCYVSPVANYAPAGAVNLALRLNFNPFDPPGGGQGIIFIGAVAIRVK